MQLCEVSNPQYLQLSPHYVQQAHKHRGGTTFSATPGIPSPSTLPIGSLPFPLVVGCPVQGKRSDTVGQPLLIVLDDLYLDTNILVNWLRVLLPHARLFRREPRKQCPPWSTTRGGHLEARAARKPRHCCMSAEFSPVRLTHTFAVTLPIGLQDWKHTFAVKRYVFTTCCPSESLRLEA